MTPSSIFLTARWRYLAMLNYAVNPALLAGRVPPGTELDFFDGRAYVSVVGFRFLSTRVLGLAIPLHQDFDEINLRFYVRRRAEDGWRRGVAFVRELVPKPAIALVARLGFCEPYTAVRMSHEVRDDGAGLERRVCVAYGWRDGTGECSIRLRAQSDPAIPAAASVEQFIAEHYWGYGIDRRRRGLEYAVRHDPWRVWRAEDAAFAGSAARMYGPELAKAISGTPDSAFLAEGSTVSVSWANIIV